ncbi:hypothetical protein [Desulforhopalus singaporensis]|uniref:Uncharacterized protein n=1 Tax=Desulforhopalus singaporensis TaxID=91360 RepID=A0A1H0RLV7_9BACT|nr:hypothetical protein [Desulforhopalus singaporensis]SDP30493.1 hypothetical protein SAMN05660330_02368 [Desulforhopalus singaporensis]
MKRTIATGLTFFILTILVSSCTSTPILKTLNIDNPRQQEQITADSKTIKALRTKLAAAREKEAALSDEIGRLKDEIDEKQTVISIQGKVIGLLDDGEQTLQKSIEAQIKKATSKDGV